MSVPTPAQIQRIVKELREQASRITLEYRWVHGAAHARTVGDQAHVHTTSVNDPTQDIATGKDKASMRRALGRASKALDTAQAELKSCEHLLKQATAHERERVQFEALRYPRTATRDDLAEGEAAKGRRHARGEGIPE
jgi:hypothetical protein